MSSASSPIGISPPLDAPNPASRRDRMRRKGSPTTRAMMVLTPAATTAAIAIERVAVAPGDHYRHEQRARQQATDDRRERIARRQCMPDGGDDDPDRNQHEKTDGSVAHGGCLHPLSVHSVVTVVRSAAARRLHGFADALEWPAAGAVHDLRSTSGTRQRRLLRPRSPAQAEPRGLVRVARLRKTDASRPHPRTRAGTMAVSAASTRSSDRALGPASGTGDPADRGGSSPAARSRPGPAMPRSSSGCSRSSPG